MSETLFNIQSLSTKNPQNFAEYKCQMDCYVKSENRNGYITAWTLNGNAEVIFKNKDRIEGPFIFTLDDVKIIYSPEQQRVNDFITEWLENDEEYNNKVNEIISNV